MDWLFEGHLTVYLLLGVAALVCLFVWFRSLDANPQRSTPRRRQQEEALEEWGQQVQQRRAGQAGSVAAAEPRPATDQGPPGWRSSANLPWLVALGAFLVLMLIYFVLDRAVETRREQITRKLTEMANAVQARTMKPIMAHLAKDFRYFGTTRENFELASQRILDEEWLDSLAIWDFRLDVEKPNQMMLSAKPKGGRVNSVHFLVRTQWVLEADGQWRMVEFTVHKPFADSQDALPLPHLGP